MKKLLVAALTLETIVLLACSQGYASNKPMVPNQLPPTAMPSQTSAPQPPEFAVPSTGLQSILSEYYTKSKGQRHYDNSVIDDLIVIRYYALNLESGAAAVLAVAYGLIDGLKFSDGRLYFEVRPLPSPDSYIAFVEQSLPQPVIVSGKTMIRHVFIAHSSPDPTLPVNFTGQLPLQAPALPTNPFGIVSRVAGSMDQPTKILQNNGTGEAFTFVTLPFYELQNGHVVQNVGIGLVELVILDTQAPENRTSLDGSTMF